MTASARRPTDWNAKARLRRSLLEARREVADTPGTVAALTRAVLALPEVGVADTVAAYWALPGEPPTAPLIAALRQRGRRVLLPVLRPNGDLDWGAYEGTRSLASAARGLAEPVGKRLGPEAIGGADVVVVPGLAVGADGTRLGRGGGSYDRVLTRVGPPTLVVCLLWDGELLDVVPTAPHDRPVDVAVTPTAVRRFPPRSR